MQKRVKIISLFVLLILSTFISMNFISAYSANYTCNIVPVANCNASVGGNIIMGLSAPTNAHGEFPYQSYPYALCCYFGNSNTTCSSAYNTYYYPSVSVPQNKIIGLTSNTNAHAEAPGQTAYPVPICYWPYSNGPLQCVSTNLGTNPAGCSNVQANGISYPINIVNLSNYTNAHIGGTSPSFNTSICCAIVGTTPGQLYCNLTSATWTMSNAMQGVQVGLNVTGTNCGGASVTFNVTDSNGNKVINSPGDVTFPLSGANSITSTWTAEYHTGQPNNYKFTALAIFNGNTIQSGPPNATLSTTAQPANFCTSINTCADYTPYGVANCTSDSSLCSVAKNDPNKDIKAYSYSCAWNTTSNSCTFVNIYQANGAIKCGTGYTLCTNQTSTLSYCYPGNTCPSGDTPLSNGNGICDPGEGCSSIDCNNGATDSCVASACMAGMCYNASSNPVNITQCANAYTLCYNSIKALTYCYPNDACPPGDSAPSNSCANINVLNQTNANPSSCLGDSVCFKTNNVNGYCASPTASVGKCVYTSTGSNNSCSNGFVTYSWTATWTGNNNKPSTCVSGSSVIECPAQIPLPLFTPLNALITILVVIIIYVIIILLRKSKHQKRRRKR